MHRLILITHRNGTPLSTYLEFVKACALSGITAVQLREKDASIDFLLEFGKGLKSILDPIGVPLFVNDSVDLALKLEAHGVHLGQTDESPLLAQKRLGPKKVIGLSLESASDLAVANELPLAYVAASSVFASIHKDNPRKIWGLSGLRWLSQQSRHPMIGIGGITEENVTSVLDAGAQGIAVIGALHQAKNPSLAAQRFRQLIDRKNS